MFKYNFINLKAAQWYYTAAVGRLERLQLTTRRTSTATHWFTNPPWEELKQNPSAPEGEILPQRPGSKNEQISSPLSPNIYLFICVFFIVVLR